MRGFEVVGAIFHPHWQRNSAGQMLQELPISLQYKRFSMTSKTQIMRAKFCRPRVELKAKLQSASISLEQFAKRMGQPNFSAFNKWKQLWLAGFLEKKHWSIIWWRNRLNQLLDEPLHWEMAVADFLGTFGTWLPLDNFDHAECIWRLWVEMLLKKSASDICEACQKWRRGNKRTAMDSRKCADNNARGNVLELPNTTYMVVIDRVPKPIMTRHPVYNCKLHTQMWGTGRSCLISSKHIVAQMNHPVWPRCTNATWHRTDWTKSIWDYTHRGKWWTTHYMVSFHTTVPFLTCSSWNWDTMWNNFW